MKKVTKSGWFKGSYDFACLYCQCEFTDESGLDGAYMGIDREGSRLNKYAYSACPECGKHCKVKLENQTEKER